MPIYRRSSRSYASVSSRTCYMYIPVVFAPTSYGETDTRTNYFRSHKQSRDLKGEFKLFASFTRPRRSRLLARSLPSFHPSSLHLIPDTLPLSSLLFRSFPISLLYPHHATPGGRVLLPLLPLSIRKDPGMRACAWSPLINRCLPHAASERGNGRALLRGQRKRKRGEMKGVERRGNREMRTFNVPTSNVYENFVHRLRHGNE